MKPRIRFGVAVVAFANVACAVVAQPMLSPPAGPITATSGRMGVRTEIRSIPYVIGAPGSYYLSQTLTQTPGMGGVVIISDNVTLDLMGFSLIGVGIPGVSGITLGPGVFANITVHDGFVTGWGGSGVDLGGASRVHVFNVGAAGNGVNGVSVGASSIVRNCIAYSNGSNGFALGSKSKGTNLIATLNTVQGILTADGCHVSDSTASFNGLNGYMIGDGGVVIGSTASTNGGNGFELTANVRVTDCVASFNGFTTVFGNGFAAMAPGSILSGCAAYNNANNGFVSMPAPGPIGSAIHDSIASFNGFTTGVGDGISDFKTIMGCTANTNAENGIQVFELGHVVRNTCEGNTVNGIAAMGGGNVIEFNTVALNGIAGIITILNPGPALNFINGNRAHYNGYVDPAPFVPQYVFGPFDSFAPIFPPGPPIPGPLPFAPSAAGNANIVY